MNPGTGRLPWIDTLRGLAMLALTATLTRSMLHPVGASYGAQEGPGGILWWMLVETFLDQTGVWLFAIAAGLALAARRAETPDDRQWTIEHRARLLTLAIAALAHAYYVFPHSMIPAGVWACLILSKAIRDQECRPIRTAALAALVPILFVMYETTSLDGYLSQAGATWTNRFEISTTAFDAWETASYSGSWTEQTQVRHHQWLDAQTGTMARRTLWQMAAGILFGLWWHRAGRHRERPRRLAAELAATGLLMNVAGAVLAQYPVEPGLMMRIADQLNYAGGGLVAASVCIALTMNHDKVGVRAGARTLIRIGNTALTTYLLWTTVLAMVAGGLGLGLHGQLSPLQTATLWLAGCAVIWTAAQRWNTIGPGPMERIWRRTAKALIDAAKPA